MDTLRELLEESISKNLYQIVISNPRKKDDVQKIKVRPILLKEILYFQETRFVNTKVMHENITADEMITKIMTYMSENFKQLFVETTMFQATVLVSKRGSVNIKKKNVCTTKEAEAELMQNLSHNRTKNYILEEGFPVPFLVDLGVQTKDGKIVKAKYDKFKQLNRYLEYIRDILPMLPKERSIQIIDFGCGKSYLTFAMYYYLKIMNKMDIHVIGLDLKEDVIDTCNILKEKYEFDCLTFLKGDIGTFEGVDNIDMVVTLHACDTATDYALAKAVTWNAKVILSVPCCQHEVNKQIKCDILKPVLKYGLIKERMAALVTDALRAQILEEMGYETQILEFIDMEHTPKNILIRAVKKSEKKRNHKALAEMLEFLNIEPTLRQLLPHGEFE